MRAFRKFSAIVVFAAVVVFLSSTITANAQGAVSYRFLEVIDYADKPVANAVVNVQGSCGVGGERKTNQNGQLEKGLPIGYGDCQTYTFSIAKEGFYPFADFFGLARASREPLKIELLKIPETDAEQKAIGREQEKREFFGAAIRSDAEAVGKFLKSGLSPNLTTSDLRGLPVEKDVPIIYFALSSSDKLSPNKPEILKSFLDAGANVRGKFTRGVLADYLRTDVYKPGFHSTEIMGEKLKQEVETVVDLLIKAGADLNAPGSGDGKPPIIVAAENGYAWIVKKLLDKGVSADGKDARGYTALVLLAASPYAPLHDSGVETFKLLLASGADPNVVVDNVNGLNGICDTALINAAGRGSVDFVKLLLANGANAKFTCKGGRDALVAALEQETAQLELERQKVEAAKILIEAGVNFSAVGEYGATALMIAARRNDASLVRMLLAKGAPVNAQDKYDRTALMYAAFQSEPRIETINALLDAKADVNVLTKSYNQYNGCQTALMQAAGSGKGEIIRTLLARRADPNLTCEKGDAPVVYAARSGRAEAVRILLEAGADAKGEQGSRALSALKYIAEHPQYYDPNAAEDIKKLLEAAGAKQ